MKTKVILSLTISFFLFFIITSTLTKPVIASETIALPASAITDGDGYTFINIGEGKYYAALKFVGIDTDRSITSVYLQLTGGDEIVMSLQVAVADNSWSNGDTKLPSVRAGQSVSGPLGSPIEEYPDGIAK